MDPIKKRKINENSAALTDSDAFNHITLTIDDARRILEPFTHDQLLGIVQNALLRHPDVLDAVRSLADRDTTKRKLFIRGLGWETTTEKLRALFSLYGELDEAAVILDKVTGKSKGYGFITFKHIDGAILALKEPSKPIDGRMTVTQLASAGVLGGGAPGSVGGVGGVSNSMDVSTRKIYVGNVPLDMPAERLLQVFSMYGEVEEGPLGFDKATGKSKGFALFVYKTAEAARASLLDPVKNIDGHQLNCKLASDGKRGKPPGVGAVGPMGGQGGNQSNGDGTGAMPAGQYGVQGVNGGQYGGFSSNLGANSGAGIRGQGLSTVGGQAMESNLGGSGGFGADGSHIGWPYAGGSHISGSIGTGYGGGFNGVSGGLGGNSGSLGGVGRGLGSGAGLGGGAGSGLSGHGAGLGGAGGGTTGGLGGAGSGMGAAGRESSFYSFPPSSVGMGTGDYPRSTHYSISSGGYQGLLSQPAGALPAPRLPPGGSYQGMPPYY